jgi:hypothetical protein
VGNRASNDVDHPAIHRQLLGRIHARASHARKGDDRAWTGAIEIRDLEGFRHTVDAPCRRYVLLRLYVFVDGEHFTLTEPNDMVFLDYFLKLCTAEDDIRPL